MTKPRNPKNRKSPAGGSRKKVSRGGESPFARRPLSLKQVQEKLLAQKTIPTLFVTPIPNRKLQAGDPVCISVLPPENATRGKKKPRWEEHGLGCLMKTGPPPVVWMSHDFQILPTTLNSVVRPKYYLRRSAPCLLESIGENYRLTPVRIAGIP